MTDNLPVQQPQPVIARRLPGPADCWWRLGPNIRTSRTAEDRGLVNVVQHVDFDSKGFYLTIELRDGYTQDVWPSDYNLVLTDPDNIDFYPPTRVVPQRLKALDLFIERPPLLRIPLDWQQITRRGDHDHPGEDMHNWRYDNPGAFL
ncbi:hypothetical protein [Mycobacteroides abscessus]|uniref:hypothetical protein n=1 Tax=Mycobacteroides abscessus TaxID=36809 RepID=UPI00092BD06E|nr:hypothetical protein [Mycobacteroides abscessus]SHY94254.1 Uncharacterised protein [Mycobacteroides abscessus subsp. abscessus]SHZ90310.1 Uncharacterised protein [Mycobacteroides abscessus subsp. abscessus]SHZ90862.1 Uncharacterised protein [Mycobacteroides abscessus subsp. abscessus]SIA63933.1 Uncharacterised protein [Mycobacteroides abscessus subsp. abscessus]SIC38013.1 Uncharacterised protein [Mycobacteroides abscessus subsp. abscessus]